MFPAEHPCSVHCKMLSRYPMYICFVMYNYVSTLTGRWGHVSLYLSPLRLSLLCYTVLLCCEFSVLWVCFPFISLQLFISYRRSNTRRWPNAGLMLAHCLRCWANINPVLTLLTLHLLAINLYGYAAGGETSPVFLLKKNQTLLVMSWIYSLVNPVDV